MLSFTSSVFPLISFYFFCFSFTTSFPLPKSSICKVNHKHSVPSFPFSSTSLTKLRVLGSTLSEEAADPLSQTKEAFIEKTEEFVRKQGRFDAVLAKLNEKIGTVDESRILFPEYESREVPHLFSALKYTKSADGKLVSERSHGNVLGATALIAGTAVGAGILALPTAIAPVGFWPSAVAIIPAWVYMTISGLLIAELNLNRIAETGRSKHGLLELVNNSLGKPWNTLAASSFFFLEYTMLMALISQGGNNINTILSMSTDSPFAETLASIPGASQATFTSIVALAMFGLKPTVLQNVNIVMVAGMFATFGAILAASAQSTDFLAVFDAANQHPEQVLNCLPILFSSLVFQSIVPSVVTQLEGDRTKIQQAVIAGTTAPLLLLLAWNAVVLGNFDASAVNPITLFQENPVLGPLVTVFSSLAILTSTLSFTRSLMGGWDSVGKIMIPNKDATVLPESTLKKLALFSMASLPPLAWAITTMESNPDAYYHALEFGGAFGVSTLFLVLTPIMVWKHRYAETHPIVTKPLVPLGKIPLGSMWKAAATLILEQGAEKLGVFEFIHDKFLS